MDALEKRMETYINENIELKKRLENLEMSNKGLVAQLQQRAHLNHSTTSQQQQQQQLTNSNNNDSFVATHSTTTTTTTTCEQQQQQTASEDNKDNISCKQDASSSPVSPHQFGTLLMVVMLFFAVLFGVWSPLISKDQLAQSAASAASAAASSTVGGQQARIASASAHSLLNTSTSTTTASTTVTATLAVAAAFASVAGASAAAAVSTATAPASAANESNSSSSSSSKAKELHDDAQTDAAAESTNSCKRQKCEPLDADERAAQHQHQQLSSSSCPTINNNNNNNNNIPVNESKVKVQSSASSNLVVMNAATLKSSGSGVVAAGIELTKVRPFIRHIHASSSVTSKAGTGNATVVKQEEGQIVIFNLPSSPSGHAINNNNNNNSSGIVGNSANGTTLTLPTSVNYKVISTTPSIIKSQPYQVSASSSGIVSASAASTTSTATATRFRVINNMTVALNTNAAASSANGLNAASGVNGSGSNVAVIGNGLKSASDSTTGSIIRISS